MRVIIFDCSNIIGFISNALYHVFVRFISGRILIVIAIAIGVATISLYSAGLVFDVRISHPILVTFLLLLFWLLAYHVLLHALFFACRLSSTNNR